MNTLAERLKYARTEKKWSQGRLAISAGLSQSAVGNIEAGKRQSAGSLPLLAIALGVNHAWLAWGEGEMMPSENNPPRTRNLSAGAIELAQLYDLIPDANKIKRAQAFAAASAVIIQVIEAPATVLPAPDPKKPTRAPRS